ncbi:MAG: YdcF family protein [Pseudomonadota bacterium]
MRQSPSAVEIEAAEVLWNYHCLNESVGDCADVIVGLGSYDLRVVDRCVELFNRGLAPKICFTGASGNWTQGFYESSEAKAFGQRAVALGVSPSSIILEEYARNLGENVTLTSALFPPKTSCIWVTKPQTQRRLRATISALLKTSQAVVTAPQTSIADQPLKHHDLEAVIGEMVGDLWRIATYPQQGFQTVQHIPENVVAAFDLLAAAGFRQHIPQNVVSLADAKAQPSSCQS